jgi:hypothetical protein
MNKVIGIRRWTSIYQATQGKIVYCKYYEDGTGSMITRKEFNSLKQSLSKVNQ